MVQDNIGRMSIRPSLFLCVFFFDLARRDTPVRPIMVGGDPVLERMNSLESVTTTWNMEARVSAQAPKLGRRRFRKFQNLRRVTRW